MGILKKHFQTQGPILPSQEEVEILRYLKQRKRQVMQAGYTTLNDYQAYLSLLLAH